MSASARMPRGSIGVAAGMDRHGGAAPVRMTHDVVTPGDPGDLESGSLPDARVIRSPHGGHRRHPAMSTMRVSSPGAPNSATRPRASRKSATAVSRVSPSPVSSHAGAQLSVSTPHAVLVLLGGARDMHGPGHRGWPFQERRFLITLSFGNGSVSGPAVVSLGGQCLSAARGHEIGHRDPDGADGSEDAAAAGRLRLLPGGREINWPP
jgi:hypothetical protein